MKLQRGRSFGFGKFRSSSAIARSSARRKLTHAVGTARGGAAERPEGGECRGNRRERHDFGAGEARLVQAEKQRCPRRVRDKLREEQCQRPRRAAKPPRFHQPCRQPSSHRAWSPDQKSKRAGSRMAFSACVPSPGCRTERCGQKTRRQPPDQAQGQAALKTKPENRRALIHGTKRAFADNASRSLRTASSLALASTSTVRRNFSQPAGKSFGSM